MSNYTFVKYPGGNYLLSKECWKTEDYLAENADLFMCEHLVKDRGRLYSRYRVRSCKPMRFTDTLEYDIECPHCHDKLRLCGMPVDSTNHGLYKCRRCDDETRKRG